MNESNDLTYVVDRTAHIENLLDQIIVNFTSPRKDAFFFFWEVMLDISILPLGAKIKAVMAISQECALKIDQNALHSVISYRNAFAHHGTHSNPLMEVGANPEDNEFHYTLRIIKNSGKTEKKKRSEALEEFNKAFHKAKSSLMLLREKTVSITSEAGAEHVGP